MAHLSSRYSDIDTPAALASTAASALKRHAPAEFDDVDSENIDPLIFSSPSKKGRTFDFDMNKSNEIPLFASAPAPPVQYVERAQAVGRKRKAEDTVTPAAGTKRRAEPSSAPAPAGRSPKNKRIGILSRRRMTTSPFTRVDPPSSSTESTHGLPFSIDAALAGTVPKYKTKSKSTPGKGWHFDIHEDTPEERMTNLLDHSTCTLDISDGEGASCKGDKDNKENIPPIDGPAAVASATQVTTRRDMMTDETREPLGDLDAKDFYAEGCDASSCIIVAAEDSSEEIMDKPSAAKTAQESSSPPRPRANGVTEAQTGWEEVIARFAAKTTTTAADADHGTEEGVSNDATEIQIWESESAKGDDDVDAQGHETDGVNPQSLLA